MHFSVQNSLYSVHYKSVDYNTVLCVKCALSVVTIVKLFNFRENSSEREVPKKPESEVRIRLVSFSFFYFSILMMFVNSS